MGNRLDVLSNMHIRREYVYGPGIDNPIAMITFYDDELVGLYFYHTDALGSVIAMTSVNGVVAEKYRYSPFGRTTIYDGSGGEIARSAIGNPYMFTARRLDEESGLYYYRARMYKPEIGRFLQTDPLGYIDTINPYAYCANNPLNRIDPWGLSEWKWYNGFWGTVCDMSIIGTYFHFWYDQGASVRDLGMWMVTGMDKAEEAGKRRMNGMVPGVIQDPGTEGVKNLGRDAVDATLDMPGTLTGGPLGVPDPVGDVVGVTTTVINEAADNCVSGNVNNENSK
ncbi:MAG: RHS repeat-associated core domain-containing protein [Phycisphaerae bacterium]